MNMDPSVWDDTVTIFSNYSDEQLNNIDIDDLDDEEADEYYTEIEKRESLEEIRKANSLSEEEFIKYRFETHWE